jgi:hypothetical protein
MDTKLTIRVERRSLDAAKRYAARHGTSLSRLINAFLRQLPVEDEDTAVTPLLRELTGILPADVSVDEHRQHLAEKYGG